MTHEGAAQISGEGFFFSPLQRLQRDVTIEVLRQFIRDREASGVKDGVRLLDALSGGGVRAIRYALEGNYF